MKKLNSKQKLINVLPGRGYIDIEEIKNWGYEENIEITYNPHTTLFTVNGFGLNIDSEYDVYSGRYYIKCASLKKLLKESN
jgi:hypothetical protein